MLLSRNTDLDIGPINRRGEIEGTLFQAIVPDIQEIEKHGWRGGNHSRVRDCMWYHERYRGITVPRGAMHDLRIFIETSGDTVRGTHLDSARCKSWRGVYLYVLESSM